ncbi:Transcription factor tipo AP2/ERF [Forsythia ovata]|uniref:Transcription factor tipo AP2/ERF n=1 Tax=Forsythia ovata TaxID=205694 RepID=A0ABD1W924_9LAMI
MSELDEDSDGFFQPHYHKENLDDESDGSLGDYAKLQTIQFNLLFQQKEAAEAYDIAAIKFCGVNAVTNFEISKYDVKSLLESSTLPIGGAVRRLKDAENAEMALDIQRKANNGNHNSHLTNGLYKIMDALIPYHFILNYSPQSTSTRSIKYLQRQYI